MQYVELNPSTCFTRTALLLECCIHNCYAAPLPPLLPPPRTLPCSSPPTDHAVCGAEPLCAPRVPPGGSGSHQPGPGGCHVLQVFGTGCFENRKSNEGLLCLLGTQWGNSRAWRVGGKACAAGHWYWASTRRQCFLRGGCVCVRSGQQGSLESCVCCHAWGCCQDLKSCLLGCSSSTHPPSPSSCLCASHYSRGQHVGV
jgi:hypothetical protein